VCSANNLAHIVGPCGCWPTHEEIDTIISALQKIQNIPTETIELYNWVRETQAYEGMIDNMMKHQKRTPNRKKHRSPIPGFIYLIDDGHGNIKIGRSKDWKSRIRQFGPACKTLMVFAVEDDIATEKELHTQYTDKQVKDGWFQLTESDIQQIRQMYTNQIVWEE